MINVRDLKDGLIVTSERSKYKWIVTKYNKNCKSLTLKNIDNGTQKRIGLSYYTGYSHAQSFETFLKLYTLDKETKMKYRVKENGIEGILLCEKNGKIILKFYGRYFGFSEEEVEKIVPYSVRLKCLTDRNTKDLYIEIPKGSVELESLILFRAKLWIVDLVDTRVEVTASISANSKLFRVQTEQITLL